MRIDLEELKRLEGESTPAPWEAGGTIDCKCPEGSPNCWHQFDRQAFVVPALGELGPVAVAAQDEHDNAALIAALRNSAPALLATVEAADRVRAAVEARREAHRKYTIADREAGPTEVFERGRALNEAVQEETEALAAYRAARGEEGE